MKHTKKTIIELNNLNEKCDCGLIETDQREDICTLIQEVATLAGIPETADDITEEWREF